MKGWRALGCLVAGLSATAPAVAAPPPESAQRILLVVVDTLRRDHVAACGGAIPTPHVDRLAERGQVFSNVFSSFHQTTMSMGALFSGRTPSAESGVSRTPLGWTGRNWCGLARFAEPAGDTCVPRKLETLAERLARAGYRTAGIVANAMLFRPQGYEQGFDEWIEVGAGPEVTDARVRTRLRSAPHVLEAVRGVLPSLVGQKSFLYVHYVDVHDYRFAGKTYAQAVRGFDRAFGGLLDLLEASGWLEDAVVFFTSDHGETFDETHHPLPAHWGHGGNPSFESVLKIPLIVSPARFEAPDRILRGQDVTGLILETAGVRAVPAAATALAPDELFLGERSFLVYRKGRWKSIFRRRGLGGATLFDLQADPRETENLARRKPEIMLEHLSRVGELVRLLGSPPVSGDDLTREDLRRLRALGYAE